MLNLIPLGDLSHLWLHELLNAQLEYLGLECLEAFRSLLSNQAVI